MKKILPLILLFILLSVIGFSAETYVVKSPANYYTTTSTSVFFNWTITSTTQRNFASYFYLSKTDNSTLLFNQTILCTNATSCNTTKSSLSPGEYKWQLQVNNSLTSNATITTRWLEIMLSNESDYFVWQNDSNFIDMTLNKNTGDLNVTGNIIGKKNITASWYFGLFNWTTDNYFTFDGKTLTANVSKFNDTYIRRDGASSLTSTWKVGGQNINMSSANITNVNYINPSGSDLKIGGNINTVKNITTDVHYFNTITTTPTCTGCIYKNGTGLIIVG